MKADSIANPEKYRQRAKANYEKHRAKIREDQAIYRKNNQERIKLIGKIWRDANKNKIKDNNLKRIGFSLERLEEALAIQKGLCAICQVDLSTLPKKHVHADHCHLLELARGILCHRCNTGIGALRDDPALLLKAVEYLRNPPLFPKEIENG
jgi:hypothetical protein